MLPQYESENIKSAAAQAAKFVFGSLNCEFIIKTGYHAVAWTC